MLWNQKTWGTTGEKTIRKHCFLYFFSSLMLFRRAKSGRYGACHPGTDQIQNCFASARKDDGACAFK